MTNSKIYNKDDLAQELGIPKAQTSDVGIEPCEIEPSTMAIIPTDESLSPSIESTCEGSKEPDTKSNHDLNPFSEYSVNAVFSNTDEPSNVQTYLGGMAAAGEITLIFAGSGVGKTLCTLGLLGNDLKEGKLDPRCVAYVNKDDSGHGIREKVQFANEFGFNVISDGLHNFFDKSDLFNLTRNLVHKGDANKSLIIIDTVKKFHDVNDKRDTIAFYKALRPFTLAGGTVVGVAHTNKFTDQNGASVYAGVADNIQDVDAAYIGNTVITPSSDNSLQVVEFKQEKGRLAQTGIVYCGYASGGNLTWRQRLKTMHVLSDNELKKIHTKRSRKADEEIIVAITETLRIGGSSAKMELVKGVAAATVNSGRRVLAVLDRYTGSDPELHLWNYEVVHRGAKSYRLLDNEVTS